METLITALIYVTVVPLTAPIPLMVSSGLLLVLFAAIWVAFGRALMSDRPAVDRAWLRIRRLPLAVQAIVWLLFLPPMAGLWIYRRPWRAAYRLTLIGGLGAWNLLVFLPDPLITPPSAVVFTVSLLGCAVLLVARPELPDMLA